MENLSRRVSGIWFARLVVPLRLRSILGRSEFIQSTGTHHHVVAKAVATGLLAQWRRQLLDIERLAMGDTGTDHANLIKIADGHPTLSLSGYLTLPLAAAASGISDEYLLKAAAEGRLRLFWQGACASGFLVHRSALPVDDSEHGSVVIPHPHEMPASAYRYVALGPLPLPADAVAELVNDLLKDSLCRVSVVAFDGNEPGQLFVPDSVVHLGKKDIEVSTLEVEALRRALALTISPAQLEAARAAHIASLQSPITRPSRHSGKLLSEALAAYTKNKLYNSIASENEVKRRSTACGLLIELAGDRPVAAVDADSLREFRDNHLSRVPANENKVRLQHGTKSVSESIAVVAGSAWPVMSAGERNKRMEWIRAWFSWLKAQGWLAEDPAAPLAGESVLTAAESRENRKREDQNRDIFEVDHFQVLFTAQLARDGRSTVSSSGKRPDPPVEYWLPLLGLYTGARIAELCQLHLSDFGQTTAGTWFIDFNERTPDKRLKTPKWAKVSPSLRVVPVHPRLLQYGLGKWIETLRAANYQRLFPELIYSGHDKGYSKDMVKWFSSLLGSMGYERNGTLTFHSFRHTFINALPSHTPERLANQLTGHQRGSSVRSRTYSKDLDPDRALEYVKLLTYELPKIATFDTADGLLALKDALGRKQGRRKGKEDMGPFALP